MLVLLQLLLLSHQMSAAAGGARISLTLAKSLCAAVSKFASSKEVQPQVKDSRALYQDDAKRDAVDCEVVLWSPCDASDSSCSKFSLEIRPRCHFQRVPVTTGQGQGQGQGQGEDEESGARIIGGSNAQPHQFKHLVVVTTTAASKRVFNCVGSIYNPFHVITAAHCVHHAILVRIMAGKHNMSMSEEWNQTRIVSKIIVHEKFNSFSLLQDVALLKVDDRFVYNEFVRPIPLVTPAHVYKGPGDVAGWGRWNLDASGRSSPILQTATLNIIDQPECLKQFKSQHINLPPGKVCVGKPNSNLCDGDAGGPLSIMIDGKYVLGGVASGTERCANPALPSVFTAIPPIIPWITKHAG